MTDEQREDGGVTRLSFIKASAGAAAGARSDRRAGGGRALDGESGEVPTEPSTANPREPVMAYVRDAERGEVTVMSGTSETTYRDRSLVKRLLDAAPQDWSSNGGGIDVSHREAPRSARTRRPTTPTSMRSSPPTGPTPSR